MSTVGASCRQHFHVLVHSLLNKLVSRFILISCCRFQVACIPYGRAFWACQGVWLYLASFLGLLLRSLHIIHLCDIDRRTFNNSVLLHALARLRPSLQLLKVTLQKEDIAICMLAHLIESANRAWASADSTWHRGNNSAWTAGHRCRAHAATPPTAWRHRQRQWRLCGGRCQSSPCGSGSRPVQDSQTTQRQGLGYYSRQLWVGPANSQIGIWLNCRATRPAYDPQRWAKTHPWPK